MYMNNLNKKKGVMLVLSSPSGAGKSSICKSLMSLDKNLSLSVSTTTRKKRPNEKSGEDYIFVSTEEFKNMLSNNNFIEYANVFDNYYGTVKSLVDNKINNGQDSDEVVKKRMDGASAEITHWAEYDYVIINEDLNKSVNAVLGILKAERMKRIRQVGLAEFVRSITDNSSQ